MSGSGPVREITVDRPEPRGARCPRCDAPIAGDFKFCPTCAFRLRAGLPDPGPPTPPRPVGRHLVLAGLAGAVIVSAIVAAGYALVVPAWLRTPAADESRPSAEIALEDRRPYAVSDIPAQLRTLAPNGYAYSVPLVDVPGLSDDERNGIEEALRANGLLPGTQPSLEVVVPYRFQMLRAEVTRGQYEEFLRDIDEHRDRIPTVWLEWDRRANAVELDIVDHVPPAWIRSTGGGATEWGVESTSKNLPVAQVSYVDAQGFCEWATRRLGLAITLPFEAEWIRAARPPSRPDEPVWTAWPWGATPIRRTFACNSLSYWLPNPGRAQIVDFPYPEGNGGATVDGLLAMAGNVREWAVGHDVRRIDRLLGQPPVLTWSTTPASRRSRTAPAFGGSFRTGIDDCQIDSRANYLKTERRDDVGFRIVVR